MMFSRKTKNNCIVSMIAFSLATLLGCGDDSKSIGKPKQINNAVINNVIAKAEIHNPSLFTRKDESLYISFHDLGLDSHFSESLGVRHSQKLLPSQHVDMDFDGQVDGILFTTDLLGSETLDIEVVKSTPIPNFEKRTQAEISHKQGGEWGVHEKYPDTQFKGYTGGDFVNVDTLTPEKQYTDHSNWIRYEGPGIESDKVGYRIYLDRRNGFDIFGKLIPEPVLQKVGQDGYASYHEMQPWGMDLLKVGSSLGAGGFGLWHKNTVSLISDVDTWTATIQENGTQQSSFSIDYKGWKSPLGRQDLTATVSMKAGSRLAHLVLDMTAEAETMAVGVVKHNDTDFIQGDVDITGKAFSYIASWGKQSLDGGQLGMAVFFRKELLQDVTQDENNYLAILSPQGNPSDKNKQAMRLDYYFAAVWDKESGITTKQDFVNYLEQQAEILTIQPRVRLKTQRSASAQSGPLTADKALSWAKLLADSELTRKGLTYNHDGWDVNRKRVPKFEYDIVGIFPNTFYQLGELTGEHRYKEVLPKVTGSFIESDGTIKRYQKNSFNIDAVAPGVAVLSLYKATGEEKYRKAADILRDQLKDQPKTSEGAFWHKQKYTSQVWLDGVYMGMPFLAEYSNLFEQGHSLEEVVNEFVLTRKYLKDKETGYYYHAWDEQKKQNWANPETGVSPEFWARGMGWMVMSLVDVLALIPDSEAELRAPLLQIAKEVAVSLEQAMDKDTHTWWQIMDKPGAVGNYRESSSSAMFTYFYAKAVGHGYIDQKYQSLAVSAYKGLLNEFILVHDDGTISMTNQCYVAGLGFGRDGSYRYYMTEPVWKNDAKGSMPFILASMAMHEMLTE
ncbi:MAG: DUF4861 family protein [Paraglaciecola sp.]|uniref:DUF4861 family protein n=1 Tax=Paraglaciecola sp. TaxID=1920173 RepID=UPI0032969D59